MNTLNFNKKIIDGWWKILSRLSSETRIELAARLINSLKSNEPIKEEESWEELFGSWKEEDMPAADMATFVRESRVSYRKNASFD